jgi:putative FmdB family regulatory protein
VPTYEYKCEACGHAFENFQPMSADPIKKCPVCGKNKVKRLIGAGAGLIFKGSGFYITDYREQGYTDKAKADKPPETKESATSSGDAAAKSGESSTAKDSKPAASESKPATESKPAAAESKPAPKAETAKSSSAKKSKR